MDLDLSDYEAMLIMLKKADIPFKQEWFFGYKTIAVRREFRDGNGSFFSKDLCEFSFDNNGDLLKAY